MGTGDCKVKEEEKEARRGISASVSPSVQAARMSLAADFSIYLETLLLATCL
jgi:hypothetical protein